jgi:hypothetical protein
MVFALLALTGGTALFFVVAPAIGYPMEFEQGWAIAQISIPVLVGYLGTAIQFAVNKSDDDDQPSPPLLSWLAFGPIAIYVICAAILLLVFGITNGADAPVGRGMSTGMLSTILTALLGIVTVTSNVAIARLFRGK